MPGDPTSASAAGRHSKRRALILLAGALVLLFVLAIGITDLPLQPGEPFAVNIPPLGRSSGGSLAGGEAIMLFVRVMLALALLLLPINLVLVIVTREGRRRLLINFVTVISLWLWLTALSRIMRNLPEELFSNEGGLRPAGEALPLPPLPDFVPNPPDWTVLAVALAISLLAVGLAAAIGWAIWRRWTRRDEPLARLGRRAQAALDELQSGGDFRSAVIRCYRDMTRVLQQERGIQREIAMTPSEFELALRGKGLPHDAVHQLTRVFEDVRYGGQAAGEREERLAMDSLAAIVAACAQARETA